MVANYQQMIIDNLARVQERICQAAETAGRQSDRITLIGVTKRKPVEMMVAAIEAGLKDIGENRLQEARKKFPLLDLNGIKRHLIGHLQTNKAKYIPGLFDVVHSVDSERIALALNRQTAEKQPGATLPVFVQVNVSGEASKFGVPPDEASDLVGYCLEQRTLNIRGLMAIGPHTENRDLVLKAFKQLRQLAEQIQTLFAPTLRKMDLSMGMTDDFELAIAEGATHVRVGRAIFGERD